MSKYLCFVAAVAIFVLGKDDLDRLVGSLWAIASVICSQVEASAKRMDRT